VGLDEASLAADVASRLFAPSSPARTIGAELELIPVDASTKAPARIGEGGRSSLIALVRNAAAAGRWREISGGADAPSWNMPDGSRLSFEPGGQIEISTAPNDSCSALIGSLQASVAILHHAMEGRVDLLSVGVDPYNGIEAVPLQLHSDRYTRMTRYLAARGEFGIRMMRQTAALQISVEHGTRPFERWKLLNAVAPYLLALFANSSRYAGADTGHASYRAHFWRELDASRTGIPFAEAAPAARYTAFALDAGAIAAENGSGEFHSFRSLMDGASPEDWRLHLSTLFPEVRAKEYFEIRSADTIDAAHLAAPLAFVAGLVYDDAATRSALDLLGAPDSSMLRAAGREGLRNSAMRSVAAELVEMSIQGASRLPLDYLSEQHRSEAAVWLRRRLSDA
jgi:glutamate--cysteine ligase